MLKPIKLIAITLLCLGFIYISINNELAKAADSNYSADLTTAENIGKITNNCATCVDLLTIKNFVAGARINVYESSSATTPKFTFANTYNETTELIWRDKFITTEKGSVYLTLKELNKLESKKRLKVDFESDVTPFSTSQVKIENAYDWNSYFQLFPDSEKTDKVTITGLLAGDKVNFCWDSTGSKCYEWNNTVKEDATSIVINDAVLPDYLKTVWISVKRGDKNASKFVAFKYKNGDISSPPDSKKIQLFNDGDGNQDIIRITGVKPDSYLIAEVIDEKTKELLDATRIYMPSSKNTFRNQLPMEAEGGTFYFSLLEQGKWPSKKIKMKYQPEN